MITRTVTTQAGDWQLVRVTADEINAALPKAIDQSRKKALYSMAYGQDSKVRSDGLKFQMQLMGTIAEIAVADYLSISLKKAGLSDKWQVVRYDDVRTDGFRSPEGEYDIKLIQGDNIEMDVESRSSIAYNRSLEVALNQYDIIGPYTSDVKKNEALRDFYARPLYAYLDYQSKSEYSNLNFEKLLNQGRVELYIVGGCNRDQMAEKSFPKSMGQGRTRYNVVPILQGYDAIAFSEHITRTLSRIAN
jgi:hypothetical protein